MATWNHRVVRVREHGEELLCLSEVHYNDNGDPVGYSNPFMHSETMGGLVQLVDRLKAALKKPVLDADTDFPMPLFKQKLKEGDIVFWTDESQSGGGGIYKVHEDFGNGVYCIVNRDKKPDEYARFSANVSGDDLEFVPDVEFEEK